MRHAVMLFLSAAALASCGGAGGSGDPASGQNSREAQERARLQLNECLRKQGIDLPDQPGQGGGSNGGPSQLDREKLRSATDGPCKRYRQQAFGDVSPKERQDLRDQMVKFSSCMREHGVDLPDPGSGGERRDFTFSPDDPKVKKATEACRDKLPQRFRGGGGGPGLIGPPR